MTQDQTILFALFGTVFALLLWGRFRYDLVAFSALLAGVVLGVVPASKAFSGFGHPRHDGRGPRPDRLGGAGALGRGLSDHPHPDRRNARPWRAVSRSWGGIGGVLSAFMNNVAALALLMPVDIATARKAGRAPGLSLMPLSLRHHPWAA